MSIKEVAIFLSFFVFLYYFFYFISEFVRDLKFYTQNGWDLEQRRKESVEIFEGDLPSETPLQGRSRFIGMIFVVIFFSVFMSIWFCAGVLPVLRRIF